MAKLSKKQQVFVAEYLTGLNATESARKAGYSEKTAESQGSRLLRNVKVAEAIAKAMQARNERTEISQDRVLEELSRIAFGDLRDAVVWGPGGVALLDSALLTDEQAAAISEVGETVTKEGGSVRIKRHDKVKALELLMRHMGMLNDKLDVDAKGNLTIKVVSFRDIEV